MRRLPRQLTERERINAIRQMVKLLQRIAHRDSKLINGRILRQVIYYLFERLERTSSPKSTHIHWLLDASEKGRGRAA